MHSGLPWTEKFIHKQSQILLFLVASAAAEHDGESGAEPDWLNRTTIIIIINIIIPSKKGSWAKKIFIY